MPSPLKTCHVYHLYNNNSCKEPTHLYNPYTAFWKPSPANLKVAQNRSPLNNPKPQSTSYLNHSYTAKARRTWEDAVYFQQSRQVNSKTLPWPLKPFEKYSYIGSLVKASREIFNISGAYPEPWFKRLHGMLLGMDPLTQSPSANASSVPMTAWPADSITTPQGRV